MILDFLKTVSLFVKIIKINKITGKRLIEIILLNNLFVQKYLNVKNYGLKFLD